MTTGTNKVATHTNQDNWDRVTRLEQDVAGLHVDVQYIRAAIDQLVQHNQRTIPWGAIVSLVSVVVLVLGGFSTMLVSPIAAETQYNRAEIRENQQLDRNAHSEMLQENSYLRGRVDALTKQVEEIDIYGSRKWNDENRP